jgi:hypothetical protein
MKNLFLLAMSLVAVAAWAPGPVAPRDIPACNEACQKLYDQNGVHNGNACVVGTFGYGCLAGVSYCSILNEGCLEDPEGGDFPAALELSTRNWRRLAGQEGDAFLARLTCEPNATRIVPSTMVAIAVPSTVPANTLQPNP